MTGQLPPADTLRRAAAQMRDKAQATCPDDTPWYTTHLAEALNAEYRHVRTPEADAAHIAGWHPQVALAVADLLSLIADRMVMQGLTVAGPPDTPTGRALAVARAYLGGAS